MTIRSILNKLEEETKHKDFASNVIMDDSSDSEIGAIWYEFGRDDPSVFDTEEFEGLHKTDGFPTEGPLWEEALNEYIESKWYDFSFDFEHKATEKDGKLVIYRMISVNSIPRFLYFLGKGKVIPGFKGLGVYWSWDKNRADAHWGSGSKDILVTALVSPNDISYKQTAFKNLNPSLGEDEAEIEVKPAAKLLITSVEHDGRVIWKNTDKDEVKIAAKYLRKLF
jgi:hypothetical protein